MRLGRLHIMALLAASLVRICGLVVVCIFMQQLQNGKSETPFFPPSMHHAFFILFCDLLRPFH